jgi:UDP-glucose 4-epimerase
MSRVAVTGGAGFVGSNLVIRLMEDGHDVVVVDDFSTGLRANLQDLDCELHELSITDEVRMKKAISKCQVIFHLGARGSVPRSIKEPRATHEVNATGTLNVLEAARESGAHVLFSSSSSVYGRNMQLPKDETMWLGPMTPYAASKLSAEAYVQSYASSYQIPTTLFRFFNIFGPRQRPDHEYAAVLPKWIWLAMHGHPIEVFGDGTVTRDFTYIDTVVDVATTAMNKRIVSDGPINLAFGNRISLNETIEILRQHFPDLKVTYLPQRPGDVKDSQNAPALLNSLFPEIRPKSFETALKDTIVWLRDFGNSIASSPTL